MADDSYNEDFEPDWHAEAVKLTAQLAELQLKLEAAEAALRASRVAGRRQKASEADVDEAKRAEAADEAMAHSPLLETAFDSITLHDQVASGGFGAVHRASWHGATVAAKRLFDPVITDQLRAEFQTEVRILSRLRHPNIVQFLCVALTTLGFSDFRL